LLENKKSFIGDISLNIFSLVLSTGVTQLIIYPIISSQLSTSEFGFILTIMGIINVIAVVVGGTLNNVQLIDKSNYLNNKDFLSDFKRLFIMGILAVSVILTVTSIVGLDNKNFLSNLMVLIIVILTTLRAYAPVYWRIELNYKNIFYHSLISSTGYLFGTLIFYFFLSDYWEISFLIGEFFSTIYIFKRTIFGKIKIITKSTEFRKSKNDYFILMSSNIVSNSLVYFDRFILQVAIGSAEVSVYFAASIFGKLASMVLQPISGVFLSYLSREGKEDKKKFYLFFLVLSLSSGTILYILSLIFSPFMIRLLYSNLYDMAEPIMNYANLSSILMIIGSLFQPVLLKYSKLSWQNVIQVIYASLFVFLSWFLISRSGISGFVQASVISNFVRLLLFISIGYYSIWRKEND